MKGRVAKNKQKKKVKRTGVAKKGEKGIAVTYISRTKALKKLQINLREFR